MEETVAILLTEYVTHDVKRFIVEKPDNYKFTPGQATEVSIDLPEWKDKKRPFTFTSLNSDLVLEFIIKCYPAHNGVTKKMHELKAGDRLIISEPWGAIAYQGVGTFIAGGTGITPFIAIFRDLAKTDRLKGNRLIFSNKTAKDVILEKELKELFADDLVLVLSKEKKEGYCFGRIDQSFVQEHVNDFSQHFYVCGPPRFVADITDNLKILGAKIDATVTEK